MTTIQLLFTVEEARILREALTKYVEDSIISEESKDVAWMFLAEITSKIRKSK